MAVPLPSPGGAHVDIGSFWGLEPLPKAAVGGLQRGLGLGTACSVAAGLFVLWLRQ